MLLINKLNKINIILNIIRNLYKRLLNYNMMKLKYYIIITIKWRQKKKYTKYFPINFKIHFNKKMIAIKNKVFKEENN